LDEVLAQKIILTFLFIFFNFSFTGMTAGIICLDMGFPPRAGIGLAGDERHVEVYLLPEASLPTLKVYS